MSKTKNLIETIRELREAAQTIANLSDQLEAHFSSTADKAVSEKKPKRDSKKDKAIVRQLLAKKAAAGYTDQIRDLLQKFGAEKLSDIDPKDYEDLYYSAEGLGQ